MRNLASLVVSILWLCSCARPLHDVAPSQRFEANDNDAIILVRVTPKAAVIVASGEVDEHGFRSDQLGTRKQFWSQDGYAILKVPPTEGNNCYGIVAVRPEKFTPLAEERPFTYATVMWHKSIVRYPLVMVALAPFIGGGAAVFAIANVVDFRHADGKGRVVYSPRERIDLPVFKAVAGEVAYIGAIRVDASRRQSSADAPSRIAITPIVSAEDAEGAAGFLATHYPNVHSHVTFEPFQMVERDELGDN